MTTDGRNAAGDLVQRSRRRLVAAGCLRRAAPIVALGEPDEVRVIEGCLPLLWGLDDRLPAAPFTVPLHERIRSLIGVSDNEDEPGPDEHGLVFGVLELADYCLGLVDDEESDPVMVSYRTEEVWVLFDRLVGRGEFWYPREEELQREVVAALDAGRQCHPDSVDPA